MELTNSLDYQKAHIHDDRKSLIIAVSISLMTSSVITVALRFLSRWIKRLRWEADDYTMVPALGFTLLICIETLQSVRSGVGRHQITVTLKDTESMLFLSFKLGILFILALLFVKMSILLFYRRTFTTQSRAVRIMIYTTMGYLTCWAISSFLVFIFVCSPISYLWRQADPTAKGSCNISLLPMQISMGVLNTIADVALIIIPVFTLSRLQMSLRRKLKIIVIFSVGSLACTASIVRIYFVSFEQSNPDLSWDISEPIIWTGVEPTIGIICACFPIIYSAFKSESRNTGSHIRLQRHVPTRYRIPLKTNLTPSVAVHESWEPIQGAQESSEEETLRKEDIGQSNSTAIDHSDQTSSPHRKSVKDGPILHNEISSKKPAQKDRWGIRQFYPRAHVERERMAMSIDGTPIPADAIQVETSVEWTEQRLNTP